jgi:small-conductance mechanosensitive channel
MVPISAALVLLICHAAVAMAQSPPFATGSRLNPPAPFVQLPDPGQPDRMDASVARLTDAEVRRLLIDVLRERTKAAEAASTTEASGLVVGFSRSLQERAEALAGRAEETRGYLSELSLYAEQMLRNLTDQEGWPALGRGLLVLMALLSVGWIAERLLARWTEASLRHLRQVVTDALPRRLGFLATRLALRGLGLMVFAVGAYAGSFVFFQRFDPMRVSVTTCVVVVVVVRAASLLSQFLLAPKAPEARLWPMADGLASGLHRWLVAMVAVGAFGFSSAGLLGLLGLPELLARLLTIAVGTILASMMLVFFWRHRRGIALTIAEDRTAAESAAADPPAASTPTAPSYPWIGLLFAYLVFVWESWAENTFLARPGEAAAAVWSLVIVVSVPCVDRLVRRSLERLVRWQHGGQATDSAGFDRPQRSLLKMVRVLLFAIAAVLLVDAWGGGVLAWTRTPVGSVVGGAAVHIGVAVLLALAVWVSINAVVDQRLAIGQSSANAGTAAGAEGSTTAHSRAATLLPLLRTAVLVVLVSMVTMIALSSLGVDIGPLLAGAGVVGIAIGFGAQTLVRDIVAGIFFLIDDAFRVGEYIEIDDDLKGAVERISLRSMQLRHHRGPLLTLPFGELRSIINHSRDWAIYKQDFRLPYNINVDKVKRIIKRIAVELMADPEHGPKFLEPLKSQGIHRTEDSAFIVRTKFKCLPGEQFVLRRLVYEKIQRAFAAEGIEFAHPKVAIHVPSGLDRGEERVAQVAAASVLRDPNAHGHL